MEIDNNNNTNNIYIIETSINNLYTDKVENSVYI